MSAVLVESEEGFGSPKLELRLLLILSTLVLETELEPSARAIFPVLSPHWGLS